MTRDAHRSQRGLSTVELLSVLLLVGLLSAIAGPEVARALSRSKVRAAADDTAATIRQARILALKTRTPHRVRLVDAGDHLELELQRDESGSFATVPDGTTAFPAAVTLLDKSTRTEFTISARGVCDAGRLYLSEAGSGQYRALTVERSCAIERQ